jgi:hypothetical protein
MIGSSSNTFGVVLVFLDKDVYGIPTPEKPLTSLSQTQVLHQKYLKMNQSLQKLQLQTK